MNKGFTLVEVVIGAALLVFTMATLLLAAVTARRSAAVGDYRMGAMNVARQIMEGLQTNSYSGSPLLSNGTHAVSNGIYTGIYVVTTNSQRAGVKDVTLTLRWVNPGATSTSSISLAGSISAALHP